MFMDHVAHFRFSYSLNDFLSGQKKNKPIVYAFNGTPSVKDAIEAIGIPHTEVDVILVNETPVDFSYGLQDGDKVSVYPLASISARTPNSLTPVPHYPLRFIADVHAGKLAKALRMLGFDTCYRNNIDDRNLAKIAEKENRVVLTRDIGLLKHAKVKWGYWLRSQQTNQQLLEVNTRFDLTPFISPFTRCIECNGLIESIEKDEVIQQLPPRTAEYFNEFYRCSNCQRVYWKGSHYENMLKKIDGYFQGR
jgi:uncharacterized protein with PIN domain